jgi:hypothetical protein
MTRIYENRGLARRMTMSMIVVAIAFLFGLFEIWSIFRAPAGESGYGYLFALFFIFGGLYAYRQLQADFEDTVVALDADETTALITLWRPLRAKRIDGPLSALTGWRKEVKSTRNMRIEMLVADHANHPKPLRFETGKGILATDAFMKLAAVDEAGS